MAECPYIDRSSVNERMFEKVYLDGYVYFRSRISSSFVQFCRLISGHIAYPEICADEDLAKSDCPWYSRGVMEGR